VIDSLNTWTFDSQDAPAPPPAGAPVPAPATNTTTGTAAPGAQQPQGSFLVQMVPFIIIFILFYMLLIRPQRRQQKEREKMITALKKNDHVITSGGICGIVDRIKDNDVYLRVDEKSEVRLRVIRSSIAVVEKVSGAEDTPEKK
jgi:preprotein translocase subunit YajC